MAKCRVMGLISWLTDTGPYPARWDCGDWSTWLGWVHIGADFATFLAYTTIPLLISAFVLRRRGLPFPRLFWLFCLFIFSCGTVHLLEAVIFWTPLYRISAVLKVSMAVASWATVFALFPALPKALRMPRLAAMTESLQREVSIRMKAEQELQATTRILEKRKDELEDSNRELNNFAYVISHDLKEPLRGIRNYVRFIDEDHGPALPEPVHERLTRITEMAQRLESQIQSLHDFSKVGRTQLDRGPVALQAVLEETLDRLADPIDTSGAEIELPVPLPSAWCDRSRIGAVFQNLLGNALKYTDEAPRIEITWVMEDQSRVRVEVSDQGVGIPESLRDSAFQPFKRLSANREGSGMGLSIAQRVVERHGGEMWIKDKDGQGTTFAFTLPIQPDPSNSEPDPTWAETSSAVSVS